MFLFAFQLMVSILTLKCYYQMHFDSYEGVIFQKVQWIFLECFPTAGLMSVVLPNTGVLMAWKTIVPNTYKISLTIDSKRLSIKIILRGKLIAFLSSKRTSRRRKIKKCEDKKLSTSKKMEFCITRRRNIKTCKVHSLKRWE